MWEIIRKILRNLVEYPLWTYGLECGICKMSLIGPGEHLDQARKDRTVRKHQNKIPKL